MTEIQDQRKTAYVEIYHQTRVDVETWLKDSQDSDNPWARLARNVATKYGLDNVHFEPRILPPIPNLPRDTPVVIGGACIELCVTLRAEDYRRAGFRDVTVDPEITVSLREISTDLSGLTRCIRNNT